MTSSAAGPSVTVTGPALRVEGHAQEDPAVLAPSVGVGRLQWAAAVQQR